MSEDIQPQEDKESDTWLHMSESDYARVIFSNVNDSYPTDADVECCYQLTDLMTPKPGDFIGLYRIGFKDEKDHAIAQMCDTASPIGNSCIQLYCLYFKAHTLPKDDGEFYQFCYFTSDGEIRGASTPFLFRRPSQEELTVNSDGGDDFLIVQSQEALVEGKFRQVERENRLLKLSKKELEEKVESLESELSVLRGKYQNDMINMEELRKKVNYFEIECQEYENRNTKSQEEINSLVQTIEEEKKNCDEIILRMSSLIKGKEELAEKYEDVLNEKKSLKVYVEDLQLQLQTSRKECDTLQLKLAERTRAIVTALEEEKKLHESLEKKNEYIQELKRCTEDHKSDCESFHKIHIEMENKLATYKDESDRLSKALKKKEEERQFLEGRLEDTKAMLSAQEDTKTLILAELKSHKMFKSKAISQLEKLEQENYQLKQKVRAEEELKAQRKEVSAETVPLEQYCTEIGVVLMSSEDANRWKTEEENLSKQVSDLKLRLDSARDLFIKSYVHELKLQNKISKLKKKYQDEVSKKPSLEKRDSKRKEKNYDHLNNFGMMAHCKEMNRSGMEGDVRPFSDSDTGEALAHTNLSDAEKEKNQIISGRISFLNSAHTASTSEGTLSTVVRKTKKNHCSDCSKTKSVKSPGKFPSEPQMHSPYNPDSLFECASSSSSLATDSAVNLNVSLFGKDTSSSQSENGSFTESACDIQTYPVVSTITESGKSSDISKTSVVATASVVHTKAAQSPKDSFSDLKSSDLAAHSVERKAAQSSSVDTILLPHLQSEAAAFVSDTKTVQSSADSMTLQHDLNSTDNPPYRSPVLYSVPLTFERPPPFDHMHTLSTLPCPACNSLIPLPEGEVDFLLSHLREEHSLRPCPMCGLLFGLSEEFELFHHVVGHFP